AGAVTVTLGDAILRTETAGIVASALAIHARGGLGAHHG
ncbi:MAG: 16S rRNA (uracil(1498)-N(3))-methyltransferase, partial [Coriobacteriia bacterium]